MAQAHVHCISFKQTWQLLSGVNKAKCCVRNLSASLAQQNFQRITGRWTEINMALRLVQFASKNGGERRMGVELQNGGSVVDLSSADVNIPKDMRSFLEAWDTNIAAATQAVEKAKSTGQWMMLPGDITLQAPIYNPEKLICIGMNYVDHCTEQNMPVPVEPIIFSKFNSSITEPNGTVILPSPSKEVDYEVELAFVMGKQAKNIDASSAMSYVAGFTVAHDVSARDWQMKKNGGQWLLGKTFDTFCPLGPALVTTAALSDPHNLGIRCRLNGETVQNSNTNQLVHKTEALVSYLSKYVHNTACFYSAPDLLDDYHTLQQLINITFV